MPRCAYGEIASATVRCPSMWSTPFCASSSTTRIAMSFQNDECDRPSTILPEREIVVGDARARRAPAGRRPLRVIVRQDDHHEIRHLARRLPLAEVRENVAGLHDVGHFLRPPRILAHERAVERRNVGVRVVPRLQHVAVKREVVRPLVVLREHRAAHRCRSSWRSTARTRRTRSTVFLRLRRLPQESARRIRQRVDPLRRIAPPVVERPHRILGLVRLRQPLMPVGRVAARAKK